MRKFAGIAIATALIATSLSAFSAAPAKEKVLGLAVDQLFESRVEETNAIKAEAEKQGYKVIEVVADGDAQNQNAQIQSLIGKQVSALLVCAVDQNTVETVLVKAKRAGIPIVAYDRALPKSKSVDSFVGPDSISDGFEAGKYTMEQLKGLKGEVKVLELLGALNDQNGIDRSAGFNKAMKGMANVKIIQVPTDWDSGKALAATQNAFQANPDIKAIFAATDTQIPSIETVLKDVGKLKAAGQAGHVVVTGVNGSKDGYISTVKGTSDGIVVMDLKTIGVTTVQTALSLIAGKKVPKTQYIPGKFYSTKNIAENKANIWGAVGQ